MPTDPQAVIHEIDHRGGKLSAQFLASLVQDLFRPKWEHPERENVPPMRGLADLSGELENRRANPPGGVPFNLIPSPPGSGACCPLCVGLAPNGFRSASSVRRPNFNQLSLLLAEHWLRCRGPHAETLVLTPEWNQRVFEERFEGLHTVAAPVFIVECARTGLILRFPY
jgi:hypothetical protein